MGIDKWRTCYFNTNSQTQAHYVVDSTTRDRVFRFWIDGEI